LSLSSDFSYLSCILEFEKITPSNCCFLFPFYSRYSPEQDLRITKLHTWDLYHRYKCQEIECTATFPIRNLLTSSNLARYLKDLDHDPENYLHVINYGMISLGRKLSHAPIYIQCITFLMLEIPIRVTNCESKHDCKRKGMPLIQVKFHGIIKKFHRDVP
jgi:hypothetical protein